MMTSGSFGSMRTWLKYIGRGFSSLTFFHDVPPSSDRYRPVGVVGVTVLATVLRPAGGGGAAAGAAVRGVRAFDHGVEDVRGLPVDVEADASQRPIREAAAGDARPGFAR